MKNINKIPQQNVHNINIIQQNNNSQNMNNNQIIYQNNDSHQYPNKINPNHNNNQQINNKEQYQVIQGLLYQMQNNSIKGNIYIQEERSYLNLSVIMIMQMKKN